SWREGVLLSVIVHLLLVIGILLAPKLFPFDAEAALRRALLLQQQQQRDPERFVFGQPPGDLKAPRPPAPADSSDQGQPARPPQQAPQPTNPMPFSRGNSPNPVEEAENKAARGQGPSPEPSPPQQTQPQQQSAQDQPKLPELSSGQTSPIRR